MINGKKAGMNGKLINRFSSRSTGLFLSSLNKTVTQLVCFGVHLAKVL